MYIDCERIDMVLTQLEQLRAGWPQESEQYGGNLAKLRPQRHRGINGSIALYNMVQCWHGTLKNTVPIHNMSSNAVPTSNVNDIETKAETFRYRSLGSKRNENVSVRL
jgi:hypothetical protein